MMRPQWGLHAHLPPVVVGVQKALPGALRPVAPANRWVGGGPPLATLLELSHLPQPLLQPIPDAVRGAVR
jgi:hypothetical protein